MDSTPWSRAFKPMKLSEEQSHRLMVVREAFTELAAVLDHKLPSDSGEARRYRALVKTNLEQAAMYATKAFTHG